VIRALRADRATARIFVVVVTALFRAIQGAQE
jgi:hypothetical protein